MTARINMEGQRFGRWAVKSYDGNRAWVCECDCGEVRIIDGGSLRAGRSRGCIKCHHKFEKPAASHNGKHSRLYNIWCGMKRRCCTETDAAYPRYGGRGIKVCTEWREDFTAFREWALSNGYEDHLTIDRMDNDKGYNPKNCRWATKKQQNRNYSRVHMIEIEGRKMPLIEAAEKAGLKPYTVRQRIFRMGWSVERALTTPVKGQPLAYTFTVERMNIDALPNSPTD